MLNKKENTPLTVKKIKLVFHASHGVRNIIYKFWEVSVINDDKMASTKLGLHEVTLSIGDS